MRPSKSLQKTSPGKPAPSASPARASRRRTKPAGESHRYWLNFTATAARRPLIWEMSRKYDVVFDIRNANVTADLGIMAIELTGDAKVVRSAVAWLQRNGVQVDPI